MSLFVLHMDKFKKEAVRGIQSHNLRERKSHSNPDIEYERSARNYELHENAPQNYAEAVQNRIDDLLLTKAVRKDAVHLCGIIVSSDAEFFKGMSPKRIRYFFEVCKERLTTFVGKENVISAVVHMDEKTPHMHFLHVPVTKDGRLNANAIYTRDSLELLQDYLPQYLKNQGFDIQRGVKQKSDSKKKHLDTPAFKQQQNALNSLKDEVRKFSAKLEEGKDQEAALQKRVRSYEQQAQEAEKVLREEFSIPDASVFNFKSALEKARVLLIHQKHALAGKAALEKRCEFLEEALREERKKKEQFATAVATEKQQHADAVEKMQTQNDTLRAELEAAEKFMREPEVRRLHVEYVKREEVARLLADQQARKQHEREEEARRRDEEKRREPEMEQRPRMRLGR